MTDFDIKTAPRWELEKDLKESYEDAGWCRLAIASNGGKDLNLSDGMSVKYRMERNEFFIEVIEAELKRRDSLNAAIDLL